MKGWPLRTAEGEALVLPTVGRVRMSDGEGIRRLALAGVGPACLAAFTIRDDLARRALVPLLEEATPGDEATALRMRPGHRRPRPVASTWVRF